MKQYNNIAMNQCNNRKSHKGFTLIELLVVVGVVAILTTASMVIINPSEQLQKSRDAQRKQDLRQLQVALDEYQTDNNRYPAKDGQQISGAFWGSAWPPYMGKVPKDPLSTQSYLYQSDGQSYRLYAKLERCPDPQTIPDSCSEDYNYVVASSNKSQIAFSLSLLTPTLPPPPPTSTPTSTPIPPTPTPTPLPSKYVFVTGSVNGDIKTAGGGADGLDGADKFCTARAEASSNPNVIGKTWKAWLSTSTTHAKNRVGNFLYKRVDNVVVANGVAELIDGTLDAPIKLNPEGISSNGNVWTGTGSNGTVVSGSTCNDWSTASNIVIGVRGWSFASTGGDWTKRSDVASTDRCSFIMLLYCFEQ